MMPPKLLFTQQDSDRAHREWGANCGPHSLAAALGISLEHSRALLKFKDNGSTTGKQLEEAISKAGKESWYKHNLRTKKLCEGINQIVWPRRWLSPGVPMGTAGDYHFNAHFGGFVFDTAIPPSYRPDGWVPVALMEKFYLAEYGDWHVTTWVYNIE